MDVQNETKILEILSADVAHDDAVMEGPKAMSTAAAPQEIPGEKFSPYDLSTAPRIPSGLPAEIWTIIQSAPAAFPPQYFLDVSRNLLGNPNLTATHLARAELSYQSFADATFNPKAETPDDLASIVKHMSGRVRSRMDGSQEVDSAES
jgi:tRNASer (uridine44-2'-O)-methyltransferase